MTAGEELTVSGPYPDVGTVSPGEAMAGFLLSAEHRARPDQVPGLVLEAARIMGAVDAIIHLADVGQRTLVPFGAPDDVPHEIDSTLAGRAFRSTVTLQGDGPTPELQRLWVPILDGAERMGVLELVVTDASPLTIARAELLASIIGTLLVCKDAYGDAIALTKRRRPMSLPAEMRLSVSPPLTFSGPNVEIAAMFQPAYDIAGDAFDYAINGDQVHLAIFDAMGHGLAASELVNLALFSYRSSRRLGHDLQETYRAMDAIVGASPGEGFVTAQLALLDTSTGEVDWVNAGHPPPLLVRRRSSASALVGDTCLPVGLGSREADVGHVSLEPNDCLVFYSDGVVEARSEEGEEFGTDRLVDYVLRAIAGEERHPEAVRRLVQAVLKHQQNLQDDATVMFVQWLGR